MKYGVCIGPERIREAAGIGFDYAELGVSQIASMPEEEYRQLLDSPIPLETFNLLFPASLHLLGGTPEQEIREYLTGALGRVRGLGGQLVVFGSGSARRVPEGMPFAEGFRRLVGITQLIGDVASSYNLSVAIEPLRYKETNMIHTLSEGCALSAMTDRPNVGLLADTIHFWDNGEPVYEIRVIRDFMHIHFSSRDRFAPIPEEIPLYREFYNALKDSGYDSRISMECGFRDFKSEAAVGLSVLKQLFS